MRQLPNNTVFIVGATASGKSAVAMHLALRIGAEIISLDSMQLWREMDIGTAKPSAEEREQVPHHLVDILDPSETFSVARYVELASGVASEIHTRGRVPLFVGGTALYLKALVSGLFDAPSADWGLRRELQQYADEHGAEALHARLREVDEAAAARLHPNDVRRVIRALEVYQKTGTPISEMQREWKESEPVETPPMFGIDRDRSELYERIERRVDAMMDEGLLDEIERLIARGGGLGQEASQALGYRELIAHLNGEYDIARAVELIKRNTRRFAKRQLTWLRKFPQIVWVHAKQGDSAESLAEEIIAKMP